MGTCTSPPVRKKPTYQHDREFVEAQSFHHKKLPKLSFHAILANVILKKYPYKKAMTTFRVADRQFRLDQRERTTEDAIKWKIHEKFHFEMTQYELRKNCLDVSISNESNEVVGNVRINLFLITTGPFHQDFALEFGNGELGRISFDLKISQIISLQIQSIAAQIFLLKNHPGEEFSYSIKTIVNLKQNQVGYSGSSAESEPSYPAMVLLEKKTHDSFAQLEDILEKESYFTRRKSQRMPTKKIDVGRNLTWSQDGGTLPSLETKVLASDLHNTYLQVLIWKEEESEDSTKRQFFADSYVSFYKLFGAQANISLRSGEEYQSRSINMTQKIERYGKDYGKGSFTFNIINQPYFRQYQICVHTELGVLKTAPIFAIQETKTSQKCPELQELLAISQTVEQNVFHLNQLQSDQALPREIKKVKLPIETDLEKMFHLLEKSQIPNIFVYKYNSESDLLRGQKILVELGMKVTKYLEIEDPVINDVAWLILISLIKRSQFNLSHMGFQDKQKRMIENRLLDKDLTQKRRIGSIYKMFLYKLLNLALNSLNRKGSEYERTFAQIFSAYAYFRIPQFRKEILRLITNQNDPEIIQWRGVQFNLQDDIHQRMIENNANIFSQLFDWQQHFYKWLAKDEDLQSEDISLNDILIQQPWKERFVKRGLAFFYFLKYWVTYIESTLPDKKDIQWRYFPGYNRLLKGFFVQMKQRPILNYPDALIESCFKLLVNEKLVNPVIKILLNKVNVYDTSAVLRVIEYLNLIFKSFTTRKKSLPISFNYSFFFKGIKIILESEFSMGISSALSLIYNHFSLFHIEFRRSLSMYLLGRVFFRLFLNWSYTVRKVFYHLITYKIYGQAHYNEHHSKSNKYSIADSDILSRYDELMKIMQNEETQYNKKRVQQLENNLDKHYYKKMKFKAYQKFASNRFDSSSIFNTKAESEIKNNSEQKSYEDIQTETKFNLVTSRKTIHINEKQHSSETNITAKISSHNKENLITHEDSSKRIKFHEGCEELNSQFALFQRIIHEKEFEIQQIQFQKIKYISIYQPQFKEIEKAFIQCLEREDRSSPIIKIEISIDNREIRPDKIDDW